MLDDDDDGDEEEHASLLPRAKYTAQMPHMYYTNMIIFFDFAIDCGGERFACSIGNYFVLHQIIRLTPTMYVTNDT